MSEVKTIPEITQQEWDTRKLTRFGYFSTLRDLLYILLSFGVMGGISMHMIPSAETLGEKAFWYCLITMVFIFALDKILKMMDPRNNYQTVIIKKE